MNRLTGQAVIGSVFALGLAAPLLLAQHGNREDGKAAATVLPMCPVTGEPANLTVSAATDEGPVFFCCKMCIPMHQSDPAKYAKQVAAQRKVMADRPKIQVTCPVTKEPVNPDVFVESNGKKITLCCKGCIKKYQRDPGKYAAALANSFTYQTKCPVMGGEIDPVAFAPVTGGLNVYFCCKGCDKKFFDDPKKYTPNLAAQGFTIKPTNMMHDKDGHRSKGHDGHDH